MSGELTLNLACLDDGNIHFSHETVTDFLSHL